MSVEDRIRAAEPATGRAIAGLVERLERRGRLRAVRVGGRPTGAAALAATLVRGVADDSRRVRPGALFVALPGFHVDGHDFVAQAAGAGAAALVVQRPVEDVALPQLVVDRSSEALAEAAAWWYGDPSLALGVVGITGTDGKTTTSFLALAALEAAGLSTGLVGTIETKVGPDREAHPAHVTTPGAPVLQATLAAMLAGGNAVAVVETTSHALALDRVVGLAYDAAIFTNLSHEHLELHGSWEAYRAAKLRLFEQLAAGPGNPPKLVAGRPWPKVAVVNRDDPSSPWFEAAARGAGAEVVTYGTDPSATVRATRVEEDARGLRIDVAAPSGSGRIGLQLAGRFNVHNALAVVALGEALGLDAAATRAGLASIERIPGRLERIDHGQPFGVVVDYAHSPASLEGVLELLAPLAAARGGGLVAVFGSAGERDVAKRPAMGRIAGERCRLVVLTDEDPRGEDRLAILDAIAAGAEVAGRRRGVDLLLVPDRPAAIRAALERAGPGDVVLLAGKGHETSILYADHERPWDEVAEVRAALEDLGYPQPA